MKKKNWLIWLLLSVWIPVSLLTGTETKRQLLKGHAASSVINQSGHLVLIYKNQRQGLSTAMQSSGSSTFNVQSISPQSNISSPIIKKDRNGQLWTVWEEEHGAESLITLALMDEDGLLETQPVSQREGFHISPDLTFDHSNNPWVAWISYAKGDYIVHVKNMRSKRAWQLNGPLWHGAYSPQIAVDTNNKIWVVWAENREGQDDIVYSSYDGFQWAPPSKLGGKSTSPRILPTISLDGTGRPCVSWSSHDGRDYEIYFTRWDGYAWSPEERVTTNHVSDSQPCLAFVSGDIPIFVWVQTEGSHSRICLRYKLDQVWSPVYELDQSYKASTSTPKISTLGDRLGVTWQSKGEIRTILLSFPQLQGQTPDVMKSAIPTIPTGEWPDENKYIGFGDSITFGMIDFKETPQLGYIPRLESLLYKTYGPTQVINEGWPGERTENGLARIREVLDLHKALFFLLMEGTNDVVFRHISLDTTVYNLEQMIKICRDKSVFPVLTTIIPRSGKKWEKPFFRDRIFELNDKIRELAARVNVSFIDMFEIFYTWPESDGGWTSLLSIDHVHPSIKGYEVMTESWFKEIKRIPFYPSNVKTTRLMEQIAESHQEANKITWNHSQKLFDQADFQTYRIYRSKVDAESSGYTHITTVSLVHRDANITGSIGFPGLNSSSSRNYLDLDIDPLSMYKYVLRLVRKDGVVGPSSRISKNNTQGGTGH
ncbi:GDSL-type esterase/lipase family protein [Acidobacteriota bacterium]